MKSSNRRNREGLWAITCYFNPLRYRRRLANFRIFREQLQVPLVAVELAYGSEFELQRRDADILVQLRGGAVLWQKERLLNVALEALPSGCRKLAWLDCDIIFAAESWSDMAQTLLDRFAIIQLFRNVHYLPYWAGGEARVEEAEFTRASAASTLRSGVPAATCVGHLLDRRIDTCANGFAWAARRELLAQHGFFDACVLGGGDRAMICAAYRCCDALMQRHYMNERQRERYLAWAEPYYESVRAEAGFLDIDIFHLWHGDVRERHTRARHEGFQRFDFDPYTDIATDHNGCWRWVTNKSEMHEYVRGYFAARREDG